MLLSTSTNLLFLRPDGHIFPVADAMEKICAAGFRELDMNYYDWVTTPGSQYAEGDSAGWLETVLTTQKRLGVSFHQSHAYFFDFADASMSQETYNAQQEQVLRSIHCSEKMGTQVLVVHPCTVYGTDYLVRDSKECCLRYFNDLLERTQRYGVTFAIENMVESNISPLRKYCASPEELVDLVDTIHDPRIGICWDFEHGDLMKQDQPRVIRMLGKRLRATHVSEQHGFDDNLNRLHRLPMSGEIQWPQIMRALREISYQDSFSFETHNYMNFLPDSCIEPALCIAYLVGEHLMEFAEQEQI